VCVEADYSTLTNISYFWEYMAKKSYVYLYNTFGQKITYSELPANIHGMSDNPYRTLAAWVRRSYGYIKCGTKGTSKVPLCRNGTSPFFLECAWAEFLSKKFSFSNFVESPMLRPLLYNFIYSVNMQSQGAAMSSQLEAIVNYSISPAARFMPGYNQDYLPIRPVTIDSDGCLIK